MNNGINDRHTHFFTFQSIGNVRCSSGLLPSNDCRLLYAGYGRIYQPTGHRCFRSVFVAALLILGGVELNLGPPAASMSDVMRLGVLNVRSAVNKAAQVHDIIDSHNLDLLVLMRRGSLADFLQQSLMTLRPPGMPSSMDFDRTAMGAVCQ